MTERLFLVAFFIGVNLYLSFLPMDIGLLPWLWLMAALVVVSAVVAFAVGAWLAVRAAEELTADDEFEEFLEALGRTRQTEGAPSPGPFGYGLTTRAAVPGFAPDRKEG